jgi:hypothetical protein
MGPARHDFLVFVALEMFLGGFAHYGLDFQIPDEPGTEIPVRQQGFPEFLIFVIHEPLLLRPFGPGALSGRGKE